MLLFLIMDMQTGLFTEHVIFNHAFNAPADTYFTQIPIFKLYPVNSAKQCFAHGHMDKLLEVVGNTTPIIADSCHYLTSTGIRIL
jgi:hypothetical protein